MKRSARPAGAPRLPTHQVGAATRLPPTRGPSIVLLLILASCGSEGPTGTGLLSTHPEASSVSVTISPKNVSNLPAEATQSFTATVTGSNNQGVTWSVQEGAWCGSVTSTGLYFAPNSLGLVCHVLATSHADTTKSDTASVSISPISMYVSPYQVSLGVGQQQTFAATVYGAATTAVTWSVDEGQAGGSITPDGVYTAPQALGTFHVRATSQADSRFTGSAQIDVVPIAISISPQTDTLGPLSTRTFVAAVVGTNHQAVTWSIQECNAGGSITQQGVYTAPQVQGVFHIVATSIEDPTREAIAPISIDQSGFLSTGSMSTARALPTATSLRNGSSVLIAGGCEDDGGNGCAPDDSAELFDPAAGTFSLTGRPVAGRVAHTATLLQTGQVLIAGGRMDRLAATAELYDPASGTFSPTGSMAAVRTSHRATLLLDGKVLITGGADTSGSSLASAELYDPSSGMFLPTGSMQRPRVGHSATLLANGKVLVAGGYAPACLGCIDVPDKTAELYDPATGLFAGTGDMPGPVAGQAATVLEDGRVLLSGGDPCGLTGAGAGSECSLEDGTDQALLYDPAAGAFGVTGSMAYPREGHSATLLGDGKVLIAGGTGLDPLTYDDSETFTAELYDPATGLFRRTGSMLSARKSHAAALLANGSVLVAGGSDSSAEVYK